MGFNFNQILRGRKVWGTMASITKKAVVSVAKPSKAAPVKAASKAAPKGGISVAEIEGAEVYNMDDLELIGRSGGGRGASAETEALKKRATALKVGQGFVIPETMRIERPITSNGSTSTIYTYKGANSVNKLAKDQEFKFRVRRDQNGNMFLFKVTR